ncbi:MAG: CoA transferase [Pseudomonadota bacterium]
MPLLDHLRVIDAASFVAAPAAATVLADFGADVIKIEPPGRGDTYRDRSSPEHPAADVNYSWILDSRNKRSLSLDLKQPRGQAVLKRLVANADVFVTNLPLPGRPRLGIEYETLKALNPRLIYASVSAYGEQGPDANRPGFDSTALWARSSLMDMVRPSPDSPPARSLPGMGDHPTAMALFGGIMAALYRRERTGTGTYVSTSLMANGLWMNAIQVQAMLSGAEYERRRPREQARSALQNLYRARDGRWFQLACTPEDKRWPRLVEVLESPALAADPRFATTAARHRHADALVAELDAIFVTRPWAWWRERLDIAGVAYGPVGTLRDIPDDEQMRASDALTPIDHPGAGAQYVVNSPVWLRDEPKRAPGLAPELGEHSTDILSEAGYEDAEIESLRASGVIGCSQEQDPVP